MDHLKPFPLEEAMEAFFREGASPEGWRSTGIGRELYADLSEPIVRQAVAYQKPDGGIDDPYQPDDPEIDAKHHFGSFTAARFVGALGYLVGIGRCQDLTDALLLSMDRTTQDLFHADTNPIRGPEFFPKELIQGYRALKDKADRKTVAEWERRLGGYDPLKNYGCVIPKCGTDLNNFVTFSLAGEAMKRELGLADNTDFIESHLATQKKCFTEFGMYRDPYDPMTYDWTSRMNIALLMFAGYDGSHAAFFDEVLRRGALTTLLFQSPTGEAPFGGRSNQQNFNEATIAVICEYEARRYKALGRMEVAGAFKRTARLAALSVKRWLDLAPVRFSKNEFPPDTQHGREKGYGLYAIYSLLIASQFGFAHMLADESIEEAPAPCETGGFILHLKDAFHRTFAACCGHHVELDTCGQHNDPKTPGKNYDATGLGRFHRRGAPTELGFSCPIVSDPGYLVSADPSPRSVAVGPGWTDAGGAPHWLADLCTEIDDANLKRIQEEQSAGAFAVTYQGRLPGCETIVESYRLDGRGLEVRDEVCGAETILVQIPLLETAGAEEARIEQGDGFFRVTYRGWVYEARCLDAEGVETFLEPFRAPNRNAIYRVGCFRAKGNSLCYRLSLEPAGS